MEQTGYLIPLTHAFLVSDYAISLLLQPNKIPVRKAFQAPLSESYTFNDNKMQFNRNFEFYKRTLHNRCLQEPICLFLHPFSISLYALVDKQPILIFTHKGIFSQTAKGNTCRRYSQKKKKKYVEKN